MLSRLVNGAAGLAGAGAFAQFPEFYQQYLQRLGGRLDQLALDLDRLLRDAVTLGRSLEAYLQELFASGTLAARQAAKRELERVDDAESLRAAYDALANAGPFERPFVFLRHFDPALAGDTASIFTPAIPTSLEGGLYAALGLLVGLGLAAGSGAGVRRARARLHQRPMATP